MTCPRVGSILRFEKGRLRQGFPSLQNELSGRANANKNFTHHMLFSYGFVNFTDNLSHLLFLTLIGI